MERIHMLADRIAQAIARGEDLSDSEIMGLRHNEELSVLVDRDVERYERNKVLNPEDPYLLSLEDKITIFLKQFYLEDMLFEVTLYEHLKTKNLLLEMKQWTKSAMTVGSGSHEILLRRDLNSKDLDTIKQICKEKLLSSGFGSSTIDTEFREWR